MTLVEFLQQRIAEDEEAGRRDFEGDESPGTWLAWVLAECAAKRRIIELHRCDTLIVGKNPGPDWVVPFCALCVERESENDSWAVVPAPALPDGDWPCDTLRALASVWSDHPDFDPVWGQQ